MRSTFHGIEVMKRSLFAQKTSMNTVGHNISNVNTEGFSRQRVEHRTSVPLPYPGMNNTTEPGQIGTGVYSGSITRMREEFLDLQFRGHNRNEGYYLAKTETLEKLEGILNEPSDTGLQNALDQMWQSWQDLTKEPEALSTREVVRQRAISLTETFDHITSSIRDLQSDIDRTVSIQVTDINSYLTQIGNLNKLIGETVPHGFTPNDMYDERDLLLDKLSKLVPVQTMPSQHGMLNVYIDGNLVVQDRNVTTLTTSSATASDGTPYTAVQINGNPYEPTSGELKGLLESRGLPDAGGNLQGILPTYLDRLNVLAVNLTKEINDIHRAGVNMDDVSSNTVYADGERLPFFVSKAWLADPANAALLTQANLDSGALDPTTIPDPTSSEDMAVNPLIINYINKIAAGKDGTDNTPDDGTSYEGDGRSAREIAGLKFKDVTTLGDVSTLDQYYRFTISKLGVETKETGRLAANTTALKDDVDLRRQSISGVSIDEEMAEMMKYQQAYNAASRVMTTFDEMLDKLINGTGNVGR